MWAINHTGLSDPELPLVAAEDALGPVWACLYFLGPTGLHPALTRSLRHWPFFKTWNLITWWLWNKDADEFLRPALHVTHP